jgi:hypothetical protein
MVPEGIDTTLICLCLSLIRLNRAIFWVISSSFRCVDIV